jgi:2-amino-4-hydroxy-6-hydroxymethyldihydropteridine diphosphokinase
VPSRCEATVYIGVGSNLGDRQSHISHALAALDATPGCAIRHTSPWYESRPIGPGSQSNYINGVLELGTALTPHELLDSLLAIERSAGRVRGERWAARTLDLDLLLFENLCLVDDRLQLPHPQLATRNFVVYPLFDLAPGLILPNGVALLELRTRLDATGLHRLTPALVSVSA